MTTKTAKTRQEPKETRWDYMMDNAKDFNKFILETTEAFVDGALKNGEQWQGVATKATKGSLELTSKQTDMFFTTLETIKRQFAKNAPRFRKLFDFTK